MPFEDFKNDLNFTTPKVEECDFNDVLYLHAQTVFFRANSEPTELTLNVDCIRLKSPTGITFKITVDDNGDLHSERE